MVNLIKDLVHKAIGVRQLSKVVQEQTGCMAQLAMLQLLADPKYADQKRLSKSGFKVYSQAEEDGIIHEIFRRIGVKEGVFVEIGVSDGCESNTLYLLRQGWKGVWIDGDPKYEKLIKQMFAKKLASGELIMACTFITRKNVNEVLDEAAPWREIDLLSLDIDGNDFHVLEAIHSIAPRVIVLEYNPVFAPPIQWVMSYSPDHWWNGTDHYSASLKSYELMLAAKGYSLVGCTINGNNAFFVKNELLGEHFCADTSAEFHYEPQRFWITKAFMPGHPFAGGSLV